MLHWALEFEEAIFTMEVDPEAARQKRVVTCAGEFEIDRVNWRARSCTARSWRTPASSPGTSTSRRTVVNHRGTTGTREEEDSRLISKSPEETQLVVWDC